VTGANVGLGKEAARHFVRLRASKVILACRSVAKGEEAKRDIESTTRRTGVLEVWPLDLADYASVKSFATRAEGLERLDVVLENAGVNTKTFKLVAGNEMNVAVSAQRSAHETLAVVA
jgi:retinol dehydrogenase-12